ncbi:MAG TPA: hypothetical protein VFA89_03870 [Terriglobales bacterium]|nr:hypothetical protein [Terriglobales bacterium]
MPPSPTKLTIMSFPQRWDGTTIKANVLVLPHEDPLSPFTSGLPAGVDTPAFAEATFAFQAMLIRGTDNMPSPADVTSNVALITAAPTDAKSLFTQLATSLKITKPSNIVNPVDPSTYIQKYLPKSYRNAFAFSQPRTPNAKTDDSYHCALRKKDPSLPKPVYSTDDISWGKAFALVLRQPLLARKLGFIYGVDIAIPAGTFDDGGWLYFDLQSGSDYFTQMTLNPDLVKRYASKLPSLSGSRSLFAAVQFPVSSTPVAGNFDAVFIEADEYNDGFAKIVHCMQPVSGNLLHEPGQEQDGLPPSRDFGIRLGWDDEQLLIWQNRQMAADPDLGTRLDAPMGVFRHRVDVKRHGEPDSAWSSLMKAEGDLTLNGIDIGSFSGELGIEVAPTQLDGQRTGIFWLPSYYTQWTGGSLIIKDEKAAKLAKTDSILKKLLTAVDADKKPLLYGKTYDFRVRFLDISGGGPDEKDLSVNGGDAPISTCRFRRHIPPQRVAIPLLANPPADGSQPTTYQVFRPRLGYPALLYTGLTNAYNLLLADFPTACTEQRETGYFDPDVTHAKIEVEVLAPEMDTFLSFNNKDPYYRLFATTRKFPNDPTAPLDLRLTFHEAAVIKFGDEADLGDLPLTADDDSSPLQVPTGRNIRIRVYPLCKEDPTLAYFASDDVRTGKPVTIDAWLDADDERDLFVNQPATREFQSILLQPDPPPSPNLTAVMALMAQPEATPSNLFQRLADQLSLATSETTLLAKPGQRVVFGCSNKIRHTLSPEHGSITFANKTDLVGQWITTLILEIDRDWSWRSLANIGFEIRRDDTELVGTIELKNTVSLVAINQADRSKTRIMFFDIVDPKSFTTPFPEPMDVSYTIKAIFKSDPGSKDPDKTLSMTLPVAVPPAQVPKPSAAGIALSDYIKDDTYSTVQPRKKILWIEFEEPVANPEDDYFVFVRAYAPDPLLLAGNEPVEDPKENLPYLPPELIRVITEGQPDDKAGLNAWQRLIPAKSNPDGSGVKHFQVPLPPGLNAISEELFGFFVCEFCVGHARVWSTAQARFGRPIRITGVQHPAPQLTCLVERDNDAISLTAPYANPVYSGVSVMPSNPRTEIWGLLYVQVIQADGKEYRNILLGRKRMVPVRKREHVRVASLPLYGVCGWSEAEVATLLFSSGLPEDSPLSAMAVELFPNFNRSADPLGSELGTTRIYRTSPLEPVMKICCCQT